MKEFEGETPVLENLGLTRMAQALAAHAGARLETVARNVANADTPGYRAFDVPEFAAIYEDRAFALRGTRAGHVLNDPPQMLTPIHAGDGMAPNGNDVSLDAQMIKATAARQSHDMALAIYQNTSDILRTSLGRNR